LLSTVTIVKFRLALDRLKTFKANIQLGGDTIFTSEAL